MAYSTGNSSRQAQHGTARLYVDVAVPVHVSLTFTYRLTESMQKIAQVGARVMVPLGRKLTTGYIVGLRDKLGPGSSLIESEIKEVRELLDVEPVVTPELLQITRWVSDYYGSPWGEVIKAALPPGISATIDQFLSITSAGQTELARLSTAQSSTIKSRLLRLAADKEELSLRAAANVLGQAQAAHAARELERAGLMDITQRPASAPVKEKMRHAVR